MRQKTQKRETKRDKRRDEKRAKYQVADEGCQQWRDSDCIYHDKHRERWDWD